MDLDNDASEWLERDTDNQQRRRGGRGRTAQGEEHNEDGGVDDDNDEDKETMMLNPVNVRLRIDVSTLNTSHVCLKLLFALMVIDGACGIGGF